ncbi:hypothetical protein BC937DRAFT_89906 [Endogone sp. FLAS-F59071]|nr:hypothetical protein BC937DRAFT_89906 [Endogone sp. FLAS-F59071]|eukprot:RUS22247.1 hypothetical protein BC937DRAFT_89906 [Endogone sp. FLAS-F59071]
MSIDTAWNTAYNSLNGVSGLLKIAKAWKGITAVLSPENLELLPIKGSQQELMDHILVLRNAKWEKPIVEWYLDAVLDHVSKTYGARFDVWTQEFKRQEDNQDNLSEWVFQSYSDVVNSLYNSFKLYERPLLILQASPEILATFTRQYQSRIQSLLPSTFNSISISFFRTAFKTFERLYRFQHRTGHSTAELFSPSLPLKGRALRKLSHAQLTGNDNTVMDLFVTGETVCGAEPMDRDDEDGDDEEVDIVDDEEQDEDLAKSAAVVEDLVARAQAFASLCAQMNALGLVTRTEEIFTEILYGEIEDKVRRGCRGKFVGEPPILGRALRWVRGVVLAWLSLVICQEGAGDMSEKWARFLQWKARLEYHLYKTFADLRIMELFDIIVDFPDTQNAVDDLKECMTKTDQKQQLLETLRHALQRRLLHPGADTSDILQQYIACIKGLRILDPSRVILEHVTHPIRSYLRTREDTIRCIVTSLVDDGDELLEDLVGEPIQLADDDVEDFNDDNWVPDPVDAGPNYKSTSKRSADIISMLVNIYDTKDVFIKEFQILLADRLLAVSDYDTEREIRNLELLKLRFGENSFHTCEVMIKDIADSKRIDSYVHKDKDFPADAPLHSIVLSKLFWPNFRMEEMQLPEPFQNWLSDYEKSFEVLKPARKLNWLSHLGTVKLELELQDRTLEFSVSPVHASIIHCFEENGTLTIDEIAEKLKMPPAQVKRRIGYWVSQGVLKEDGKDKYVLLETAEAAATARSEFIPITYN